MTLQERILLSEQKFEQAKTERAKHLESAEECLTEMNKLQGEWRLLQELVKEVNNEAATIVVPEEVNE